MDKFLEIVKVKDDSKNHLLETKYRPTRSKDWIEHETEIQQIHDFFSSSDRLLIVSGEGSTGKSTIVNLIASEHPEVIVRPFESKQTILSDVGSDVLIVDDFEFFFTNVEAIQPKQFLLDLAKYSIKTVLIIHEAYVSKLTGIIGKYQPYCNVRMRCTSTNALISQCVKICKSEGFSYDKASLKAYIESNHCNFRYIVNGLKQYKTLSNITEFHQVSMYEAYEKSITSQSLGDRLRYFQLESGTIPTIAHENIFDMKLSQPMLCRALDHMSMADVCHKQFFPYSDEVNMDTYGVLSTVFLSSHKPKLNKPRFGIIWTKQAAKFQKRKYMNDFIVRNRLRPVSPTELFYLFVLLNQFMETTPNMVKPFVLSLNLESIQSLFSVYNGFTLRKQKKMTKKAFLDAIQFTDTVLS